MANAAFAHSFAEVMRLTHGIYGILYTRRSWWSTLLSVMCIFCTNKGSTGKPSCWQQANSYPSKLECLQYGNDDKEHMDHCRIGKPFIRWFLAFIWEPMRVCMCVAQLRRNTIASDAIEVDWVSTTCDKIPHTIRNRLKFFEESGIRTNSMNVINKYKS